MNCLITSHLFNQAQPTSNQPEWKQQKQKYRHVLWKITKTAQTQSAFKWINYLTNFWKTTVCTAANFYDHKGNIFSTFLQFGYRWFDILSLGSCFVLLWKNLHIKLLIARTLLHKDKCCYLAFNLLWHTASAPFVILMKLLPSSQQCLLPGSVASFCPGIFGTYGVILRGYRQSDKMAKGRRQKNRQRETSWLMEGRTLWKKERKSKRAS